MKRTIKILINVVIPIALIFSAFRYRLFLGVLASSLYIIYIYYINQTRIFEILGKYCYSKGNIQKGLFWFRKAYESKRATPYTMVLYAYILLKNSDIEQADEILSKLMQSNLSFADEMNVKSNYALVLWKKGLIDEAVKLLEEVLEKYEHTTVYGSLGYLLIVAGDLDKALDFNLKAYEYNNLNTIIIDNLAQVHYLRGEYDKSMELYEKLMTLKPAFPEAYYNYGLVLLEFKRYQEAYDSMKKALDYDFSYLSTVSKSEVESKMKQVECML